MQVPVERLELAVKEFRALDYRHGGGACHTALTVLEPFAAEMRDRVGGDRSRRRFATALADLNNLLGWTAFDVGDWTRAHCRFTRASAFAAEAGNDDLAANICYRRGRVYLHLHDPQAALRWFGRGQDAARAAGSRHSQALLAANEAWAHAMLGDPRPSLAALALAEEHFSAAEVGSAAPWAAFFTEADLRAIVGTVLTELACTVDTGHAVAAVPFLESACAAYGQAMARSKALTLTLLAISRTLLGAFEAAAAAGTEALELAEGVQSVRIRDRLRPLAAVAGRHPGVTEALVLAAQIERFRQTSQG